MNFLDLYKKIQELDSVKESVQPQVQAVMAPPSAPMEECGEMMSHAQEQPKQQDNVSMNVTMNGSGEGGIRNLINILKNIEDGQQGGEVVVGQSKPSDVDIELGEYGNSELGADEAEVYDLDASIRSGDDLHSKGKEAPKQAGGGNPWNVNESAIASKLAKHYEEVKTRTMTESDWKPVQYGYGDPQTWGGRHYDNGDDEIEAWGIERDIEEADIDLPPELASKFPSNMFAFTYEFNHNHDLELHKVMVYDEKVDDFIDVTKYASVLKSPIWSWIEKHDLDNYTKAYIDAHQDDGDYGDYGDDDYY